MCVLCVWQKPNAFDDFYNFDVISFVNDVVDGYVTLGPDLSRLRSLVSTKRSFRIRQFKEFNILCKRIHWI